MSAQIVVVGFAQGPLGLPRKEELRSALIINQRQRQECLGPVDLL
ncbi:hypothetical protein [Vibrio comitans]